MPVSVEITYGLERILMLLQVTLYCTLGCISVFGLYLAPFGQNKLFETSSI